MICLRLDVTWKKVGCRSGEGVDLAGEVEIVEKWEKVWGFSL